MVIREDVLWAGRFSFFIEESGRAAPASTPLIFFITNSEAAVDRVVHILCSKKECCSIRGGIV